MKDKKVVDLRDPEEYGLACAECDSQDFILLMNHSVRCAECWQIVAVRWEEPDDRTAAH